jgi:hypothetical protein
MRISLPIVTAMPGFVARRPSNEREALFANRPDPRRCSAAERIMRGSLHAHEDIPIHSADATTACILRARGRFVSGRSVTQLLIPLL